MQCLCAITFNAFQTLKGFEENYYALCRTEEGDGAEHACSDDAANADKRNNLYVNVKLT